MPASLRTVLARLLLIGLFLGAYALLWRPARAWLARHAMGPVLAQVETTRARQFDINTDLDRVVEVRHPSSEQPVAALVTPTGFLFVLGTTFLLALRPRRPYWLYLGLFQWLLGGLMLGSMAVGMGWTDWGFTAHAFIREMVYPGTSLALPLVFVWMSPRTDHLSDLE